MTKNPPLFSPSAKSLGPPDMFKISVYVSPLVKYPGRVRLTIFRDGGGYYAPELSSPSFIINCSVIDSEEFYLKDSEFKVDLLLAVLLHFF